MAIKKRFKRNPIKLQDQFSKEKKPCRFCSTNTQWIDYKDTALLRNFISMRAKMFPTRRSGNCAKHQRMLAESIKRARYMALLPTTIDKKSHFTM